MEESVELRPWVSFRDPTCLNTYSLRFGFILFYNFNLNQMNQSHFTKIDNPRVVIVLFEFFRCRIFIMDSLLRKFVLGFCTCFF